MDILPPTQRTSWGCRVTTPFRKNNINPPHASTRIPELRPKGGRKNWGVLQRESCGRLESRGQPEHQQRLTALPALPHRTPGRQPLPPRRRPPRELRLSSGLGTYLHLEGIVPHQLGQARHAVPVAVPHPYPVLLLGAVVLCGANGTSLETSARRGAARPGRAAGSRPCPPRTRPRRAALPTHRPGRPPRRAAGPRTARRAAAAPRTAGCRRWGRTEHPPPPAAPPAGPAEERGSQARAGGRAGGAAPRPAPAAPPRTRTAPLPLPHRQQLQDLEDAVGVAAAAQHGLHAGGQRRGPRHAAGGRRRGGSRPAPSLRPQAGPGAAARRAAPRAVQRKAGARRRYKNVHFITPSGRIHRYSVQSYWGKGKRLCSSGIYRLTC